MTKSISLSKLASHINTQLQNDWPGWANEIAQGSDRVAALVSATLVDELLANLLQGFFIDTTGLPNPDRLAPPRDFARRIDLAFALGQLPLDLYQDLNTIRHIRNVFAHALQGVTFQTPEIAQACTQLRLPADTLPEMWLQELTPRLAFLITAIHAALDIKMRIQTVKHQDLPTNELYRTRWKTPVEPGEAPMSNPFWHLDPQGRTAQDTDEEQP
ncbi:hypothetical protein EKD04_017400 [Chloroflexales bacterium ZM16-3]|nr:hypothetical protein [Chloroflexales bacterium ZM16-3]